MSADIVTRIHNFGLGQANRADLIMAAAKQEAESWATGDDPTLTAAFRESRAVRQAQILADAAAAARRCLERAAAAATSRFLYRPGIEDIDPTFRSNPDIDSLYRAALRADLVVPELPDGVAA
jgi:hypothetical protein